MTEPLHIDKRTLFCNRCDKDISKFTEIYIENENVHCLICGNWLAGEYDCFGDLGDISPSLKHIKILGQDVETRKNWQ